MRLWSIHPQYLDTKGILAVWREGLLAQKVLHGETKGYKRHPQLTRFRLSGKPDRYIASYLHVVHQEATSRGYSFDSSKIVRRYYEGQIPVTLGQVRYEWKHLLSKLRRRDVTRYNKLKHIVLPDVHPIFTVKPGTVESWERLHDE